MKITRDEVIHVANLARLDKIEVRESGKRPETAATVIHEGATIFVSLKGIVDFHKEKERLEKEIGKIRKELVGVEKKLGNPGFLENAPDAVVDGVKEKHAGLIEKADKLESNLLMIREMETT